MLDDIKKLLKHSGIYGFGNIATKVIGIILLPLYTTPGIISVELFGIYTLIEVVMQFAVGILPLGLPNALFRWLSLKEYKTKTKSILFTIFIVTLLISVFLQIIIIPFSDKLSIIFFETSIYGNCILFVSLVVGIRLINNIGLTYIRFEEKSLFYVIISFCRLLFQLTVTIYFIVIAKYGILGIFLGQFFGEILSLLFMAPYLFRNFNYKFEISELKKMIGYGFPLTFSEISHRILNMGNRFVLKSLTNNTIVGIYGLGYKFANLVDTIFITSFRTAFIPSAWKKLNDKNAKRFYAKMLTYYVFFIFWVALFISIFAKEIIHLFARDESYWDAYKIVPVVVFAIGIRGMFIIIKMGLQYTQNTKYIAYIVSSAAFLNISLSFILIKYFGYMGAAISTLISFSYMVLTGNFLSNKFYPMNFEWKKIFVVFFVCFLLYLSSHVLVVNKIIFNVIIKLLLILSYPSILYFFKFYDEQELNKLKNTYINWKSNLSNIKIK